MFLRTILARAQCFKTTVRKKIFFTHVLDIRCKTGKEHRSEGNLSGKKRGKKCLLRVYIVFVPHMSSMRRQVVMVGYIV